MSGKKSGFTMVELMVIVAIIGILSLMATPIFARYAKEARKNSCIANMKQLADAMTLAKMSGVAAPVETDLIGTHGYIRAMPTCPNTRSAYVSFDPPECPSSDASHLMPVR